MNAARHKLLRALGPGHRYLRARRLTMALTFAALLAVPLTGLARFDLLGGQHLALGRRVDGITGAVAVAIAIFCFYVVTFILNAVLGRVFCGWGCPIGEASRLADAVDAAAPRGRPRAGLVFAMYALALSAAVGLWWLSPRALAAARVRSIAIALAGWIAVAGLIWLHGRFWRWSFCRKLCPIGLYYSVVQINHGFGIHFARTDGCIDCDLCARICPVELDARHLSAPICGLGGLSVDDMPARNHCLSCGDCVRACELVLKKRNLPRVPLRLGRGSCP